MSSVATAGHDPPRTGPTAVSIATPDSAPVGLSQPRAVWTVPALIISFTVAALLIEPIAPRWLYLYERLVSRVSGIGPGLLTTQASIAVRPLVALLVAMIVLLSAGSVRARLATLTVVLPITAASMVATDISLAHGMSHGLPAPFSASGNIVVGAVSLWAAGLALLTRLLLPAPVEVPTRVFRPISPLTRLACALLLSGLLTSLLKSFAGHLLTSVSDVPLLGGATSSILLFLSLLYVALFLLGRPSQPGRASTVPPSIAFIVPARNEAHCITACIGGIDAAAGRYDGGCTIYIIENGSADDTAEVARAAIGACRYADGIVLQAPPKGKARALNIGLAEAREEIVVRVDADTVVFPDVLDRFAAHFTDQQIGGVSGMPLPEAADSWLERMRAIEVFYNVAYKRVGQGVLDAINVLPGAMVAYRREILTRLGGFAEGINGEDADITIRVGRLGYRIVSDTSIVATTGTPRNLRELHEQRIRWARGFYHMIGRNRQAVWKGQGIRGTVVLPWICFSNFHKLTLIPFASAGAALALAAHSLFPFREVAAGAALIIGFQLAQMTFVLLSLRQGALLASLPSFLIFRLVVTYFSLEALLTVRLLPRGRSTDLSDPGSGRGHGAMASAGSYTRLPESGSQT